MHPWIRDYMLLALRVDKLVNKTGDYLVDSYTGPEELKNIVKNEEDKEVRDLIQFSDRLIDALTDLNFSQHRSEYLKKQVTSMKMTLRILNDENIRLEKQIKSCLDIDIEWIPDKYFEKGLELFEESLPGKGNIYNRYNEWTKRNIYSFKNQKQKRQIINLLIGEIRNRTNNLIELPEEEKIDLEIVFNKSFGVSTRYAGEFISNIKINGDIPLDLFQSLPILCHELYPGHHTEFCLKEKELVHKSNYYEQQLFILNSPQLVISEGIAEIAFDMIFTPVEAAEWMIKNIYNKLNIKTDDVNLPYLFRASRRNSLDQINGNVAIMLDEGYSEDEIKKYIKKYTLQSDAMIDHVLNRFKSSRFKKVYSFPYFYGKNIIQRLIDIDENKKKVFKNLLIEETYPSAIIN